MEKIIKLYIEGNSALKISDQENIPVYTNDAPNQLMEEGKI